MEINNMAQLSSPGVSVSVIDESFYTPAAAGTVPLFIVASAQDKQNGAGTGIAPGTKKSNAGTVYLLTSQKDLSDTFGVPKFYTDANNNPIHAGEQNEYGLEAAYSFLGVSNRAYVVRADLDTGALTGTATAPHGAPADGTYWFDTTDTKFGVFQWNANPATTTGGQTFQDQQGINNLTVLTDTTKVDTAGSLGSAGAPLPSIGALGDYAIVATTSLNKLWFKKYQTDTAAGTWVEVGTSAWAKSWPAATGTVSAGSITLSSGTDTMVINGTTITASGTTLGSLITQINANSTLTTAGIKAAAINGYLNLYTDGTNTNNATYTGSITLSGSAVIKVGLLSTIYMAPQLQLSAHTSVPLFKIADQASTANGAPTGSVWIKTTNADYGADWIIKKYNAGTKAWASLPTKLAVGGSQAIYALDPSGGGINLAIGQVYVKYNDDEGTPALGHFKIYTRSGVGATVVTGSAVTASTFTAGANTFAVRESIKGQAGLWYPNIVVPTATSATGGTVTITVPTMANALIVGQKIVLSGYTPAVYNGEWTVASATTSSITFSSTTATGSVVTIGQLNHSSVVAFTATGATSDAALLATAFNAAMTNGSNLVASVTSSNQVVITHNLGGEIRFLDGASVPVSKIFTPLSGGVGTANFYANPNSALTTQYVASLWSPVNSAGNAVAPASALAPTTVPADGTLWYNSYISEVDLMVHNGTTWVGYLTVAGKAVNQLYGSGTTDANGPIVGASQPTAQANGSALAHGDLWIDTSNLEMYPLIHKYNYLTKKWVLLDNADQTSENGVVFADARWSTDGGAANGNTPSSITDLLASSFLDFDAPDPALYPKGMLLWNLRRSGFNVLEYMTNYVDTTDRNVRMSGVAMSQYYPNRWVSHSANQINGAGSFGRKAVRQVVLAALNATIQGNQQLRDEESRVFNLIACPGYPETINEMVGLNADRGYTAFVIGDTPARLTPDATTLSNWGNNTKNAADDGDDGLITTNPYLGVFYPWGYTTDLLGNNVVVPPSHMILRTIALSDNVSYPWFAPAGTRRGGITNASSVGYVDPTTGEFVATALNTGQRDTLASIHVNPITYLTGIGLVNYGQYTRQLSASSLDRINVARLVVYLRRQFAQLAKPYIFEPNDTITRNQIKAAAEQLLLELVGQRALYDYLVVCDTSNNTPARIDRSELYLDVAIEPVKAVEFIYIPLRLKNTGGIKATGGV
jgi:hypothetical protein